MFGTEENYISGGLNKFLELPELKLHAVSADDLIN